MLLTRTVLRTGMMVTALGLLAGCARQEFDSPTAPSGVSVSSLAAAVDPPFTEPLPLGTVDAAPTACLAGSGAGTQCVRLTVACPVIPMASAVLRITRPASPAAELGTILLSTGGAGTFFNGMSPLGAQMVRALIAEGTATVEIAWDLPGIWGGPRPRTLACRYATAARWVYENLHQGGAARLFVAQGTSGGAAQVAFGLAHYGLSDIIALANLGGGPPGCPLCSPDGQHFPEPLLPGPPPSVNRVPQLVYPTTVVRFFLGANEPTPAIIADANAFYDAVLPLDKSMTIVPGTAHDIEGTEAGVRAFVGSIRAALATAAPMRPRR